MVNCSEEEMNRISFIAPWLFCAAGAVAQVVASQFLPPGEVICGYSGRYFAIEASRVTQGLSVQLLAGDAEVARPVPLRFRVYQMPQATPVDDLQVEHEKLMHVIGVREDLGAFFHIHRQRAAPGMWEVINTFSNAGRYQIWSDVKYRGTVYSFAHPRFSVTGETQDQPRGAIPRLRDHKRGYEILLNTAQAVLRAGKTNLFEVVVRDESGNQIGTDFFLGALLHVVIVKSDLSVYRHAHARDHWKSVRAVSFEQVFPQPGIYKIFAQLRPKKSWLPPDEAILAEFWVEASP